MAEDTDTLPPLPDGEYAIVEVMGHRTIIGRIEEVERFGAKLMAIEPILAGALLPAVLIGGGSIYQFTPCSKERAAERSPSKPDYLPLSIRAALPPAALPAPTVEDLEQGIVDDLASCTCDNRAGGDDVDCPIHGEMPFL